MIHAIRLHAKLLQHFAEPSQDAAKCIAELAMALHYIRRTYPADKLDLPAWEQAAEAVRARLDGDAYMRLASNGFLHQQCLTPYLFLRPEKNPSPFFEGMIADFRRTDRAVAECTPYRMLERPYLLHKAGAGPLPDWDGAAILKDARGACGFNRDLAYAFTHVVFFCTDFGLAPRPDAFVKGVAMLLAAERHAANDIDLFLECCICLMSQELSETEFADLLAMIGELQSRNAILFQCAELAAEYHPLFVHDLLRGLILAKRGVDILALAPGQRPEDGPISGLAAVRRALLLKDPRRIEAAVTGYAAQWGPVPWLQDMARHRLDLLADLARRQVLFEREFAVLGRREAALYGEFLKEAAAVRRALPRPGQRGLPATAPGP